MSTSTKTKIEAPRYRCACQKGGDPESRRRFLRHLGWGAFWTTMFVSLTAVLRFFFPRVLFEPPPTFIIGTVDEYPAGDTDAHGVASVSEKFMESQRVWIVREADRIYAIFGKCTHLGCTPKWYPDERLYKCPCHGSEYYSNGVNFAGPAPRPMDRYGIAMREDGRIQVDKSALYTVAHFDDPGAFLKA